MELISRSQRQTRWASIRLDVACLAAAAAASTGANGRGDRLVWKRYVERSDMCVATMAKMVLLELGSLMAAAIN